MALQGMRTGIATVARVWGTIHLRTATCIGVLPATSAGCCLDSPRLRGRFLVRVAGALTPGGPMAAAAPIAGSVMAAVAAAVARGHRRGWLGPYRPQLGRCSGVNVTGTMAAGQRCGPELGVGLPE